jgi:hypothetical protein
MPQAAAVFNEGIKDGSTFTRIGLAHQEPVLPAQRRGTDGIFHEIVINLHLAVLQVNASVGHWPNAYSMRCPGGSAAGVFRFFRHSV